MLIRRQWKTMVSYDRNIKFQKIVTKINIKYHTTMQVKPLSTHQLIMF